MDEYRTKDVSIATFFRYKGVRLIGFSPPNKDEKRYDGEYIFDISIEDAEKLKVEYVNSEFAAFEGIRRGLNKQKFS